ncbi:MAG: response regulator [Pseudomonadota bacterium]|nr:response regulator [Pseudomonadota bacterium]
MLLALLAAAIASPPLAQAHWTTADGLPVDSVNDVVLASDGYLWLATFDGLVRFDGVRFVIYDTDTTPALGSNRLLSIFEGRDGALWMRTEPGHVVRRDPHTGEVRAWALDLRDVAPTVTTGADGVVWTSTPRGLARFEGRDFTEVPLAGGATVRVGGIAPGDGVTWAACDRGLAELRVGAVTWHPLGGLGPLRNLALGADGTPWVTDGQQIARFVGGHLVPAPVEGGWRDGVVWVKPAEDGGAWVATQTGLWRWADGRATEVEPSDTARPPVADAVATDAEGHAWVLTSSALLYDGEVVARMPRGAAAGFTDLAIEPGGGAWIGTGGAGLIQLRPTPVETLGAEVSPSLVNSYALATGAGGAVWVGSQRGGLARVGPDGVRTWGADQGLGRNVTAVLEEPDGTVWAASRDLGLFRLVSDRFVLEPGLPAAATVRAIERLRNGDLLVAVGTDLWRRQAGTWATEPVELPRAPIRAILEDEDGSIWLGTNGSGVVHVVNGVATRFSRAEGFPSDTVRCLWRSAEGSLWVGTEDAGAWVFPDGRPRDAASSRVLGRAEGLPDHAVHALVDDGSGGLWGSTNRGIFRVSQRELEAFAHREGAVHADVYAERDGMKSREANGGVHRAGVRAADGRIWFAAQAGVVVVRPDLASGAAAPAPTRIEAIELRGREEAVRGPRTFAAEDRSFGITWTALEFAQAARQRFWYRLDGVDPEWVDAGTRRTAWYTQVSPGPRTFHVRAAPPGVDAPEDTLIVTVEPFLTETLAFRVAVAAGVLGSAALAVWSRLAAGRRREAVLEARVRARTADLAAEKEAAESARATVAAQAARLLEVDRLKTTFFADLSHELRTPLTLVIGPLEDVRDGRHGAIPPAAAAQVGLAERNARRLFGLVNQLLDVVRLDVGALRLDRVPQDLAALVSGVVEVHEPLAQRRGVALVSEIPDALVVADVDRREIEKVFTNLLGNALKFTPPGGTVRVTLTADATVARVVIADTGPGMVPAVRERVFERFYSARESTVQPGTGIGLSLARELTERHDGRLEVDSTPGAGSTFTVVLPLSAGAPIANTGAAPATAELPAFEDTVASGPDPQDRTTVLVVDDHPEVRAWVRSHLVARYHVVEAANGREGLAQARRFLPDLVVSDVMMPEMDGYDLVRALRADPDLDWVPVVLLTAKGSDQSRMEGLQRGADAHLAKPFSSQVLVAQVDALLAQRQRLRERFAAGPARAAEEPISADDRYVQKVRDAIEANLADPAFGVQELADAVAQDRAHLFRRIKQLTGEPPSTLLRTVRMERAALLLVRRAATVSEIAYAVGFYSVSHFSRAFREHFGTTPSAYASEGRT